MTKTSRREADLWNNRVGNMFSVFSRGNMFIFGLSQAREKKHILLLDLCVLVAGGGLGALDLR